MEHQANTTRTHYVKITREDIIDFLISKGMSPPKDCQVSTVCPTGGDWSGMSFDIGDEQTINVSWQDHVHEEIPTDGR